MSDRLHELVHSINECNRYKAERILKMNPSLLQLKVPITDKERDAMFKKCFVLDLPDLSLIQLLLKKGADPNLNTFINSDKKRCSKSFSKPPLYCAIEESNVGVARCLIEYGADLNLIHEKRMMLKIAFEQASLEMATFLVNEGGCPLTDLGNLRHLLVKCVDHRSPGKTRFLLENTSVGADINNNNSNSKWPLLSIAVKGDELETAAVLLAHGANVNACCICSYSVDRMVTRGIYQSPLMLALENDNASMVDLLLRYHADPALSTPNGNGRTPISIAANLHENGLEYVYKFLKQWVKQKASMNEYGVVIDAEGGGKNNPQEDSKAGICATQNQEAEFEFVVV